MSETMQVLNLIKVLEETQAMYTHEREAQNAWDRKEAKSEKYLSEKDLNVIDAIEHDEFSGEIVSETLPYSEEWKYFLSQLKLKANGKKYDAAEVGEIFLKQALEYIQNNVVVE